MLRLTRQNIRSKGYNIRNDVLETWFGCGCPAATAPRKALWILKEKNSMLTQQYKDQKKNNPKRRR